MCPCPFCATIAFIALLLLPFKKPRAWIKKRLQRHHAHCATCQKAAHEQSPDRGNCCSCSKCTKKRK